MVSSWPIFSQKVTVPPGEHILTEGNVGPPRGTPNSDLQAGNAAMNQILTPRKRILVDPELQTQLALRVIIYWGMCIATVVLMVVGWRMVGGPARPLYRHLDELFFHLGPALLASFVLLPIVVIDVIRVSNRFVGPLLRLRRSVRSLAAGHDVEPLRFRKGDFWRGFADDFNALVTRVKELEIAACRNKHISVDPSQEGGQLAESDANLSGTPVRDFPFVGGNLDGSVLRTG